VKRPLDKGVERHRVTTGRMASTRGDGNNGAFHLPGLNGVPLTVICSDGSGWEHVSVSVPGEDRTPTWAEMDYVKRLFWTDLEAVMQLHPPRSQHVNDHEYCLHLWRPDPDTGLAVPLPPSVLVGIGVGAKALAGMKRREVERHTQILAEQQGVRR
jgi:hypothetical protein